MDLVSGRDMTTRSTDSSGNSGYWGLGGKNQKDSYSHQRVDILVPLT